MEGAHHAPPGPAGTGQAQLSDRMRMAGAALSAALGVEGVVRGHDGGDGRYVTGVGSDVLPGVIVAAQRGGRYSIDLYLVAALVALPPLGDRVREALARGIDSAGLAPVLGPVSVTFLSVEQGVRP